MDKRGRIFFGIVLVLIGLFSLLGNFGIINIHLWELWPFIILALGLVFEFSYFLGVKKEEGLLVPGGIFITIGINFIICIILGWDMMAITWPLFIMAPGIGLFQLYLFGAKRTGVLIPSLILLSIGGLFLLRNISSFRNFGIGFAVILIIIGALLIFGKNHTNSDKTI